MERFESPECYFNSLREELRFKRDMLVEGLIEIGLQPIVPDGAYYIVVDISKFHNFENFSTCVHLFKDQKLVKHLVDRHVGLKLSKIQSN